MGQMKPDTGKVGLVNNRKEFKIYSKYFLREATDILKREWHDQVCVLKGSLWICLENELEKKKAEGRESS